MRCAFATTHLGVASLGLCSGSCCLHLCQRVLPLYTISDDSEFLCPFTVMGDLKLTYKWWQLRIMALIVRQAMCIATARTHEALGTKSPGEIQKKCTCGCKARYAMPCHAHLFATHLSLCQSCWPPRYVLSLCPSSHPLHTAIWSYMHYSMPLLHACTATSTRQGCGVCQGMALDRLN